MHKRFDKNGITREMIRVETRRGAVELKARADRDVPEGVVFIPFCYAEAAANILTNAALDPAGKMPEFKFCAARMRNPPLPPRSRNLKFPYNRSRKIGKYCVLGQTRCAGCAQLRVRNMSANKHIERFLRH